MDMVKADRGGSDVSDGTLFKECFVTLGPGAGDKGIGIVQSGTVDTFPRQIDHFGKRFKDTFEKRDLVVGNDFHKITISSLSPAGRKGHGKEAL
jgi:hypothetical protein